VNDGGENSGSAVEPGDGFEKLMSVLLDDLDRDDWAEATPLPGRDRGTGDGEAVAHRPGTRAHHVLAQATVVGAACARSWRSDGHHHRRILRPSVRGRETLMTLRMPMLRTQDSGMSAHAAGIAKLVHAFSESIGIPLRPYLAWLRLQRACAGIVAGEPLARVAAKTGFPDAAHMSRTFAFAERFVLSIKSERLDRLVPLGARH